MSFKKAYTVPKNILWKKQMEHRDQKTILAYYLDLKKLILPRCLCHWWTNLHHLLLEKKTNVTFSALSHRQTDRQTMVLQFVSIHSGMSKKCMRRGEWKVPNTSNSHAALKCYSSDFYLFKIVCLCIWVYMPMGTRRRCWISLDLEPLHVGPGKWILDLCRGSKCS